MKKESDDSTIVMEQEEVRVRIIEAAIAEFNEKSMKFTMDDLAKRLMMSKKTIYLFFKDKESLFLETADYCFNKIKAAQQEIMENESLNVVEKLEKILIAMPDSYRTVDFRQVHLLKNRYPKIYKKVAGRLEGQWEDTIFLLEEGMKEGKIRTISIPVFKVMVESTIYTFLTQSVLIEHEISYEEGLEEMLGILMNGIRLEQQNSKKEKQI